MEELTPEELVEIRARAAASARDDPNAINPYPEDSERAKVWGEHFTRALSALNE